MVGDADAEIPLTSPSCCTEPTGAVALDGLGDPLQIPQSLLDLDLERQLEAPLTEDELLELDSLLIALAERADEGRDEPADCVGDISELDGFLLAVASCPRSLTPEEWVPAVWGGERPPFTSPEEAERVLALLLRQYNSTEEVLLDDADTFDPLFAYEEDEQGDEIESVDEWCAGFLRGLSLGRSRRCDGAARKKPRLASYQ